MATVSLTGPTEPPVFKQNFANTTVEEGGPLTLDCVIVGKPPPIVSFFISIFIRLIQLYIQQVRWYFDDQPISSTGFGPKACKIGENQFRLAIELVRLEHAGRYKCKAESEAGVATCVADVEVEPREDSFLCRRAVFAQPKVAYKSQESILKPAPRKLQPSITQVSGKFGQQSIQQNFTQVPGKKIQENIQQSIAQVPRRKVEENIQQSTTKVSGNKIQDSVQQNTTQVLGDKVQENVQRSFTQQVSLGKVEESFQQSIIQVSGKKVPESIQETIRLVSGKKLQENIQQNSTQVSGNTCIVQESSQQRTNQIFGKKVQESIQQSTTHQVPEYKVQEVNLQKYKSKIQNATTVYNF